MHAAYGRSKRPNVEQSAAAEPNNRVAVGKKSGILTVQPPPVGNPLNGFIRAATAML
jgi:hypothetical protein